VVALRDIKFELQAGPCVSVLSSSGKPGWLMERHYVSPGAGSAKPTGPAYEFTGCEIISENIILDGWPSQFLTSTGTSASIRLTNWLMEGGTQDDTVGPGFTRNLFYIANGPVTARNINFHATIDDASGFYFLFSVDGTGMYLGEPCISIFENIQSSAVITNGGLYPVSLSNGATARVENITGVWTENPGLMAFGASTDGIYEVDNYRYLPTKAGAPTDADVPIARDGVQIVDTTNHRLYVREAGTWKYATLT
jgi:hypothetical protein